MPVLRNKRTGEIYRKSQKDWEQMIEDSKDMKHKAKDVFDVIEAEKSTLKQRVEVVIPEDLKIEPKGKTEEVAP